MKTSLAILGVISLLELLLWIPAVWQHVRKVSALLVAGLLAATSLYSLALDLHLWTLVLVILNIYRIINLLKIAEGRLQADYLYSTTRRTSVWLISLQVIAVVFTITVSHLPLTTMDFYYVTAFAEVVCSLFLLGAALQNIKNVRADDSASLKDVNNWPALTVAIPARNETTDLENCLQSLLTSSYPKLETLVLDDCSQNGRTPEIIRAFAHDGVRFIAGKVPPESWLAKNYAYKQLVEEANGEFLLFCGVDARFEPDSLEKIVRLLLSNKKDMLSLIPLNATPRHLWWLIQPARYAWELALPRSLLNRPPVLSTCWLITRDFLHKAGGFEAVSRKIVPESYLARQAAATDNYQMVAADGNLGITSHKSLDEQNATAIRTRYPQLHRRPEMVALTSLGELAALVLPALLLIASLVRHTWFLAALAGFAYLTQSYVYGKVANLAYGKSAAHGLWTLLPSALYDIWILNYSMWQYEFREVLWKGRNVCIPLMRAIPSLPKAD